MTEPNYDPENFDVRSSEFGVRRSAFRRSRSEGHPLLSAPNCHFTPHIAGGRRNKSLTLVRHFLANLERLVRGDPLADRTM